jgi:hypothetical protein
MLISGHETRSIFDQYNIVSERDLRVSERRQLDRKAKQREERYGDSRIATRCAMFSEERPSGPGMPRGRRFSSRIRQTPTMA